MDAHTQDRLKELITALARNPNIHNLASAIQSTAPPAPALPPHPITTTATTATTPADPPPYPFSELDSDCDDDEDDENDDDEEPHRSSTRKQPTTRLSIDASTRIIGSHNAVTVPAPHALAAMVFAALRQAGHAPAVDGGERARRLRVELNCGVDVRGDGNVVGGGLGVGVGGGVRKGDVAMQHGDVGGRKRAASEVLGGPEPTRAKTTE
ncbi:MAG: hypothetical protein Q9165_003463 [Trypethelium subeluteriae]